MSDMTRRFEVILTSFSIDKCNGQFHFKAKWLFITSANELLRARLRTFAPIVSAHQRPVYTGDFCGDLSGDFCGDSKSLV